MRSRGNTIADPGERTIVERIRERLPPSPPSLRVSAGDDAAVAVPERGALQVLTTDALVEGVHFERQFSSLSDVGFKAIAVNASDVAAMGGTCSLALLSLMLPDGTSMSEVDELLDGVLEMSAIAGIAIAGGNVSRSPGPLVVDVAMTGYVRPRRILTRGGGRPGDGLYVTGAIGAAAAGLAWLEANFFRLQPEATTSQSRSQSSSFRLQAEDPIAACVARHRRPEPRLRIGSLLGRTRTASACIDLSDGLADGVTRIAEASGTGARIDAEALPIDPGALAWFSADGKDPVTAALSGGDDYELLFSAGPKSAGRLRAVVRQARGVSISRVGELTKEPAIAMVRSGKEEPLPAGFVHF